MPRKESIVNASSAQAQQDSAVQGIDAFELPKSLVTRLARAALPESTKMQKDMLLAVLKGSTVFVNYLAASAHEVANSRQHKSVSASDVLRALEQVDMGDIVPKLQAELEIYRTNQKPDKTKRGGPRAKARDIDSPSTVSTKGKGKEKATGPTITIPRRGSASVPPRGQPPADADAGSDVEDDSGRGQDEEDEDEDEEMLDADQDVSEVEEDDDEVVESEPEDEGDGMVDNMTVEEDELRMDAREIEERDMDDES